MFDALLNDGEVFKQGSLKIISKSCVGIGEHDWRVDGCHDIKQSLTDKAFPCLFGRCAFRSGTTLFSFIGDDNMETDIVNCMKRYVEFVEHTSIEDRLFSPLIVMFECSFCKTLQESGRTITTPGATSTWWQVRKASRASG
ncbi:YqcI/YcgG family protein [Kushneria sp. TE3]|uniref:YqcI/YcgG family protein n=1 Tax=Kushneria sp. TE3 TaxID=3449832 RepID=UPI003F689275